MPVQKIDIQSSTIFRTILIVLGFGFLYVIRDVLVMLLAAFVIASAIEPMAKRLQKYSIPRGLSVVIVYVAILLIFALTLILLVPVLVNQLTQLAQALPSIAAQFNDWFSVSPVVSDDVVHRLEQFVSNVGDNVADAGLGIFEGTRSFFSGLFSLVLVLVIAFYLVIEESALKKFFRLIVPRQHMTYVEMVIDRIEYKLGRWVLAQLTLGLIIGTIVGVGLWLLGVPYALALGLLAGVLEIVPFIGPIIAGVAGVVVALSQSLIMGVLTLLFYVVVQQVENHALIPNVMKKATGLNPLVTLVAVLLGGRLAGLVGVILSIPVATVISIFLADFFTKPSTDDELAG